MKQIFSRLKVGFGVVLVVVVVSLLLILFPWQRAEMGGGETPTTVPTGEVGLSWKGVTLEQIKFGAARSVLAHTGRIWVWSWLPDNRRLLVEVEDWPVTDADKQFRIATLDTVTGEVVEDGYRPEDNQAPLWIEQTSSVVYRFRDSLYKKPPEIRIGHLGGKFVSLVVPDLAGLTRQPTTGMIYYLVYEPTEKSVRLLDATQLPLRATSPFPVLSFPAAMGEIDASGQYLAVTTMSTVGILRLETGAAQVYQTLDTTNSEPKKHIDGAWSPASGELGLLTVTIGPGGWTSGALSVFDVNTAKNKPIELPTTFVREFDWGPGAQFLVARGKAASGDGRGSVMWLVDSVSGEFKVMPEAFVTRTSGENLMAWSTAGRLAWVDYERVLVADLMP